MCDIPSHTDAVQQMQGQQDCRNMPAKAVVVLPVLLLLLLLGPVLPLALAVRSAGPEGAVQALIACRSCGILEALHPSRFMSPAGWRTDLKL